jgi:hypothetical protein
MLRPMDLWRCAIIRQTADAILAEGIDAASVVWLPDMPPRAFRADPFGLWYNGNLHVFAEAFDYETRTGHIDLLTYNGDLALVACRPVLKEPWHLSYPFIFEADGEIWLLPEAYQSGTLVLYRSRNFPCEWEPVCQIPLDGPAIDATPHFFSGKWWLFYAPSYSKRAKRSHLHVAWADRLTGPWHLHPRNPVHIDLASARPGGTPLVRSGLIVLPVQDCRATYGAAIRWLTIDRLDESCFSARRGAGLEAPEWMAPHVEGLHTFAAAGPVTLIDVKRMDASLRGKTVRICGIVRKKLKPGQATSR